MSKLREKDICNICTKSEETDKLLDYDNNKKHFKNEELNEILSCLFLFISKNIKRSIRKSKMINEDTFISNIIKIYRKYFLNSKYDINKILKELNEYKNTITIILLEDEFDKDDKKEIKAKKLIQKQIEEIDNFFEELNIKEELYRKLEKYNKFIDENSNLNKDSYNELDEIIKNSIYEIPQVYIDLFLKESIRLNKILSKETLESIVNSIIKNYSYSNNTFCHFKFKKENKSFGSYVNNTIYVSDEYYKSIYKNGIPNYSDFFNTIFHELRHLYQAERITKVRALSYEEIIMMMDYLMYNVLPRKYYDDNYTFLYTELDARTYGRMFSDCYLETLGVKSDLSKENEKDIKQHKTRYREYDGKLYIIDELFREKLEEIYETAIDDGIDIFVRHPVLNLMYTRDFKRRTTLELFKMRNEFIERSKHQEGENKERLKILIHNINEILYKQILSVEDTIKDYEELINDESIDSEEKRIYLEGMLSVIEKRSKKENISSIKNLIRKIKSLLSNNDKKEKLLSKSKK